MTNTMLGELSRLFQAEGKKAQTLSSQIRLNAIAADLRQRQYAGAVPGATMASPLQLASSGQNLGTASSGPLPIGASLSGPSMTAPQSPADTSSPTVSDGAQTAQASGPSASTFLLGVAVGLGLVIILTRK